MGHPNTILYLRRRERRNVEGRSRQAGQPRRADDAGGKHRFMQIHPVPEPYQKCTMEAKAPKRVHEIIRELKQTVSRFEWFPRTDGQA